MGELLKYGGSGMVSLLEQFLSVVWHEEAVPRQWSKGLIVLFKKGDRENQETTEVHVYYITECCRKSALLSA